jgi:hypothetical protein
LLLLLLGLLLLSLLLLSLLLSYSRLLMWWPRLATRRRPRLAPARHGRMGCVLRRGRRRVRLADLISLVCLLPLVAWVGLLCMLLLDVLARLRIVMCLR